jgi:hypothetical protein
LIIDKIKTWPDHLELLNPQAIDGDTIIAQVMLPLGATIQRRIRLKGFFAPEKRGSNPAAAEAAKLRLQAALDGHTCHIATHGSRDDRYGRLTATLLIDGRAVHPGAVLGELQLSLQAHQNDLVFARTVAKNGDPKES